MDVNYLRDFILLVKVGNYGEASFQRSISQSTLTRHIQSLEQELGQSLFDRSTRKIELSDFGSYFLPYAEEIVKDQDKADLAVKYYSLERTKVVIFGISSQPNRFHMQRMLAAFQKEHPDFKLYIEEGLQDELEHMLNTREVDIITSVIPMDPAADFQALPPHFITMGTSELCAILPKSDPLAIHPSVKLEDIADAPLLLPPERTVSYKQIIDAFRRAELVPNIFYKGNAADFMEDGAGIALRFRSMSEPYDTAAFAAVPVEPPVKLRFGLQFSARLTAAEQELIKEVKKNWSSGDE